MTALTTESCLPSYTSVVMGKNIEVASSEINQATKDLPELFLQRLSTQLSEDDYLASLQSFATAKPLTFRTNTLRQQEEEVLHEVQSAGMETKPVPWCPLCHQLMDGSIRQLQALQCAQTDGLYIQAASSMLAAHALQVEPDMRVLDLCAAPGSKTSQIAAQMKNRGMLVANDRSRKRLYRLREILQRQGATNVEVLCGPGERLGNTHADCFDRVLVDAPCSGEGRFRLDKPIRLSRWNMQEIRGLAKLQEQLLIAALRCVRVGGLVVYSTCTFAPEENELVLEKVLRKKTINAEVVELPKELRPPSARLPMMHWEGKDVTQDISSAVRIIPDDATTGFFIACLRRVS
jgi:NOL1/NOP2/sun family putative RNA methylase